MYLFHTLRGMAIAPIHWVLALVRNRGLFKEFFAREIHGRFAGSMGGSFWLLATPLCHILIYSFVFSVILKIRLSHQEVGTESFVLFLLAGLFPWMAFSEGLIRCTGILIENANIITKVVLPVELLPTIGLSGTFFVNGVGMSLFVAYLVWADFVSGFGGLPGRFMRIPQRYSADLSDNHFRLVLPDPDYLSHLHDSL
jgi:lipopolysaccharide transport system permease protein